MPNCIACSHGPIGRAAGLTPHKGRFFCGEPRAGMGLDCGLRRNDEAEGCSLAPLWSPRSAGGRGRMVVRLGS